MNHDPADLIAATMLRLRARAPFFATLALFAPIELSGEYPTAATDGRRIFVNPSYLQTLDPAQRDAVMLHAVLHAALLHVPRQGERDPQIWNMAADIVVNGILAEQAGLDIPPDTPRDRELERHSVEEVYELLRFSPERQPPPGGMDLINNTTAGNPSERENHGGSGEAGVLSRHQRADDEQHWRNALQQAKMLAETTMRGGLPVAIERALGAAQAPQIDWRAALWRYLVQTPSDFVGFDRRFLGRGLYLEALEGESLRVYVAVDTSGSVNDGQVRALVSEVQAICASYPHILCELYYADDQLYGPYPLSAGEPPPAPAGGGGTDFGPFFAAVGERRSAFEQALCIYLTDGYGLMPAEDSALPTLWVVTPGGRGSEDFPFGEVLRMV